VSMADRRAELLADVMAHVAAVLADLGIDPERADHCGHALADHLADHWGGQVISYPVDSSYKLSQRERLVLADRDGGMSLVELAFKYQMTESGLRKLLRRAPRRHQVDAQIDLFAPANAEAD
jgi:Mor family transcriptional regulator